MATHLLLYLYQANAVKYKKNKQKKTKFIRLALSYSYHLPELLVSEKYYLLDESEPLGILYCVMFSIGYIVHMWDKSIISLFCVL